MKVNSGFDRRSESELRQVGLSVGLKQALQKYLVDQPVHMSLNCSNLEFLYELQPHSMIILLKLLKLLTWSYYLSYLIHSIYSEVALT